MHLSFNNEIFPFSGDIYEGVIVIKCKDLSDIREISNSNYFKHVKELYLEGNNISNLAGIENFKNLERLTLNRNQISDLRDLSGLSNLKKLKKIILADNRISKVNNTEIFRNIQEINLSGNPIEDINFSYLPRLKGLGLDRTQINKIEGLDKLENLDSLYLNYNRISELKGLDKMTKLQRLKLSHNQISEIRGLNALRDLRNLDLSHNQISEIRGLDSLGALRELFLDNNQISKIQGLSHLKKLNILSLKNNRIGEVKGIRNLKDLRRLRLKGNKITEKLGFKNVKDLGDLDILADVGYCDVPIDINISINDYITLKLERPSSLRSKTVIYINDERFNQCKYLLISIDISEISSYDDLESIDEAAERLYHSLEPRINSIPFKIPPISCFTEFWGHSSNLQFWFENEYDTRLLHRNLAFPLLKKLAEVGDPLAKKVFKEEIAKRFESGHPPVVKYLEEEGYLRFLDKEEFDSLLL